jgi:hypothetical protein
MNWMRQAQNALQQPLQGAPGQQGMNYWPGDTKDPMKVLSQIQGVSIMEKLKGMELLTGFETGNKYMIRDLKTGADLFLAVEMQDGMMGALGRNAMNGAARPFNLKIGMLRGPNAPPERFATLERPFKCTCCCWNRPVTVLKNSRTGNSLGGIIEPCAPCKMRLALFDHQGNPAGEVNECCTTMCCFGCPCKQEVEFPIRKENGEEMAKIKKQFTTANFIGAVSGLATDTDHFTIHFGNGMTPEDKLHSIATTLFMDYAYFTKGGAEQRQGSGAAGIGEALGGDDGGQLGALIGFGMGAMAATQAARQPAVEW